MRGLLAALFAVTAMAQVPIPGPSSGTGASVSLPPFAAVSNAGTDVICALHADVITGLTCNNAVTDGTTETAFATTTTIPANVLSSSVTTINLSFGTLATATIPNLTLKVRLDGVSGTVIFLSPTVALTAGTKSGQLGCTITVVGSGTSVPAIVACSVQALGSSSQASNAAIANTTPSVAIDSTIAHTLTITAQFGANTTQNAIWLYSISSTPAGSTATISQYLLATGTLTNAQVLNMFTSPVLVIPGQGTGTFITVSRMLLENLNGGTAYAAGGTIQCVYGPSIAGGVGASNTLAVTFLTSPVVTQVGITSPVALATIPLTTINGVGIYLGNNTQNFTTGTGTLRYWIYYAVSSGL